MTSPGAAEPYGIFLAASARRNLSTLPEKISAAAVEFIHGALAENPQRVGKPLRAPLEGHYSAHRGPYRVVYQIDDDEHVVAVVAVIHRADVYRPR